MRSRLYKFGIDADEIVPRLYQGSAPEVGGRLLAAGVDVLVLAAEEYQPRATLFPGVEVIRAPLWDRPEGLRSEEWLVALTAVEDVVRALRDSSTVLVTCALGLNRSGLIVACSLCRATGCSGELAVELVSSRREDGLNNRAFASQIRKIQGSERADRRLLAMLRAEAQAHTP